MTTERVVEFSKDPVLKLRFLSHGTLEAYDLEKTRKFYTEFLGLEVVRTSPISLIIRLGGTNTIAVVQNPKRSGAMPLLNHNGLDVETEARVDECHRLVVRDAEKWGLHKIATPALQHGTYSFFFWDKDDNCWEILSNPPGGYGWMFERGDQQGLGHMKKSFPRPESTLSPMRPK